MKATISTKRKMLLAPLFTWAVMIIVLSPQVLAQIATGRITGVVTDASGDAIPNAAITLTAGATGISQAVKSGASGYYVFEAVDPGTYTLKAQASGFQQFISTGIDAHIQNSLTINIKLNVGSATQEVTVTAAAPLLQAQDASVGQTIDEQQVDEMPLASRDWTTLGLLAAGTSTSAGTSNPEFNVMGENYTQNDFRLNGIDDNEEINGGGLTEGAADNSQYTAIVPPPDAIQEFKLQTGNFSAEFGHSTGGIVNAAVKSGTNSLHGDLWEYVRNTAFNANDYFANRQHIARPAYHQNQFGGTVGGPVFIPKVYDGKNKTFFFFSYQGTRVNTPQQTSSAVPTAMMHDSNFTDFRDLFNYTGGSKTDALGRVFPLATFFDPATTRLVSAKSIDPVTGLNNSSSSAVYVRDPFYTGGSVAGITNYTTSTQYLNQISSNRIDPNAQKLLALYPMPTSTIHQLPNYYQIATATTDIDQYDIRIDEHIRDKDFFFGTFDSSYENVDSPPPLPGIAEGQAYADGRREGPRYIAALGYTHLFTPTLTNDAHAGWSHSIERLIGAYGNDLGIPAQYGIGGVPQSPGNGGLSPINIGTFAGIGAATFMPTFQTITVVEIMDNVTKVHGAHTFKTGFQIDNFHAPIIEPPSGRGDFTFSGEFSDIPNKSTGFAGVADMLLVPTASSVPNGVNNVGGFAKYSVSSFAETSDQRYYMGAYFQDDWKVTPALTLNLGLRWDHYTPYQEIRGRQANFIQAGDSGGTYYLPQKTCNTPTSPSFQALLSSYNIKTVCTSNNAAGNAQDLNFAPRIGFAYSINPRLVVRGGYGITYGALDNIGFGDQLGNNYPFNYALSYTAPTSQTPLTISSGQTAVLENALTSLNIQDPAGVTVIGLGLVGRQYNFQTPYQQTTNLMLQDEFTSHDAVSIGYVGSFGRHLDSYGKNNYPTTIMPPGTNPLDPSVPGHVPFPNISENNPYQTTSANSSYSSMQVIYQRQFSAGLTLLANYTWSKCMSDQQSTQGQHDSPYRAYGLPGFGPRGDYALCGFDTAQVIHASGTYHLPFGTSQRFLSNNRLIDPFIGGWITNFIYTHQTGQPVNISCPVATTADFGCAANVVSGANIYAGPHNVNQWLNPEAFVNPPAATSVGQSDYSPLGGKIYQTRGPGFYDLDMSLLKEFPIHKSTRLEFRVEAFNLPNSHSFGNPGSLNFENPVGFSAITSSRNNPRILQLALKLYH